MDIVLVINPGSTSVKLALYSREGEIWSESSITDKLDADQITGLIRPHTADRKIAAVVGRGGLLKPLPGGVYRINSAMLSDLKSNKYGEHASNMGAALAYEIGKHFSVPAYIVDPVTADEFPPEARLSGVPGIERNCRGHVLNIRAIGRQASRDLDIPFHRSSFVVAHLGGGISVAALENGKIIDINDALLGTGPFSPRRAGTLPLRKLLDLAYTSPRSEVEQLLVENSGLNGYLGSDDMLVIESRIKAGDTDAKLIVDTMIYQTVKECGAMSAALENPAQAILISGGLSKSDYIANGLISRLEKLAQVKIYPGGYEMTALADGAWRALERSEKVLEYTA